MMNRRSASKIRAYSAVQIYITEQITLNMNFIKRPFHHTNPTSSTTVPTNIREPVTLSTSSSTTTKPA
ncbi:unnamed protein product, partial [Rotaria magnacalcarata]